MILSSVIWKNILILKNGEIVVSYWKVMMPNYDMIFHDSIFAWFVNVSSKKWNVILKQKGSEYATVIQGSECT